MVEHKVVTYTTDCESMQGVIEKHSNEGWEVASVLDSGATSAMNHGVICTIIFKRKIIKEPSLEGARKDRTEFENVVDYLERLHKEASDAIRNEGNEFSTKDMALFTSYCLRSVITSIKNGDHRK